MVKIGYAEENRNYREAMLNFSKMHALGNDFVILDGVSESPILNKQFIQQLADRHQGIGCDQLLLLKSSLKADVACQIFNADGNEAEQCGNGMRCIARFMQEKKGLQKNNISIETKAGIVEAFIQDYQNIAVKMGLPRFEPAEIPFHSDQRHNLYEISLSADQPALSVAVLSMGNPHAILQVNSLASFPVKKLGLLISSHALFPQGTNVGFMEVIQRQHIRLRTFERGAGETLACGSNACAAVVAGIQNNILDRKVKVELALGNLQVTWENEKLPVILSGPASYVFSGYI